MVFKLTKTVFLALSGDLLMFSNMVQWRLRMDIVSRARACHSLDAFAHARRHSRARTLPFSFLRARALRSRAFSGSLVFMVLLDNIPVRTSRVLPLVSCAHHRVAHSLRLFWLSSPLLPRSTTVLTELARARAGLRASRSHALRIKKKPDNKRTWTNNGQTNQIKTNKDNGQTINGQTNNIIWTLAHSRVAHFKLSLHGFDGRSHRGLFCALALALDSVACWDGLRQNNGYHANGHKHGVTTDGRTTTTNKINQADKPRFKQKDNPPVQDKQFDKQTKLTNKQDIKQTLLTSVWTSWNMDARVCLCRI